MGKRIAKSVSRMSLAAKMGLIALATLLIAVGLQMWQPTQSVEAGAGRVRTTTGSTGAAAATSFAMTALSAAPANGNTMIAVISTRGIAANRVSSITQTGAIRLPQPIPRRSGMPRMCRVPVLA